MTCRSLDSFESELENQLGFYRPNGAEFFDRVIADKSIDLSDLGVGQSRIRLGERNELIAFPNGERVIGKEVRAFAASLLRVY